MTSPEGISYLRPLRPPRKAAEVAAAVVVGAAVLVQRQSASRNEASDLVGVEAERPRLAEPPHVAQDPLGTVEVHPPVDHAAVHVRERDRAAGCGRAHPRQHAFGGGLREVVRHALPQKKRCLARGPARVGERTPDVVAQEVDRDVVDFTATICEARALDRLGLGAIDLEHALAGELG